MMKWNWIQSWKWYDKDIMFLQVLTHDSFCSTSDSFHYPPFQLYLMPLFYDSSSFYLYRTFPGFHSKSTRKPNEYETENVTCYQRFWRFFKNSMNLKTNVLCIPSKCTWKSNEFETENVTWYQRFWRVFKNSMISKTNISGIPSKRW